MDTFNKMDAIKNHFEKEALIFDENILKLIPYYNEMLEALVSAMPFNNDANIKIIDIGCGTGTIALKIKQKFINSKIHCLDISKNMIDLAKEKLKNFPDSKFTICDFYNYKFTEKYDAAVSSLALHHLIKDKDKIYFYKKIFKALNKNGVFYNADVVLASVEKVQDFYISKWIKYMNKSCTLDEINNNWLVKYKNEDSPARLYDQIIWLKKIGFKNLDVIWKYYNFAVYGGVKG